LIINILVQKLKKEFLDSNFSLKTLSNYLINSKKTLVKNYKTTETPGIHASKRKQ